jgi:hypothetical protein
VDDSCYIGNIYNAPVDLITAVPVFVDQDGKLGTQGFDGTKIVLPGPHGVHPQAMLNEFLKEHRKVQELQATPEEQQKEMQMVIAWLEQQEAQIQKVTTQIEMSRPAAEMVGLPAIALREGGNHP